MLLIGLVAVGGFTVLAQRRLRALGMLGALGATDRNVRLVVRANGAVVGVVGTRPRSGARASWPGWPTGRAWRTAPHHLIGLFALPWVVIGPAMALAVLATYLAASRPARAVTRIPVVAALSGRPAPPKQVHRSALPGVVAAGRGLRPVRPTRGSQRQRQRSTAARQLRCIGGLVVLVAAVILLAPLCLALLGRLAAYTPVAARLALRDLARYRARSGSALAAISLGVLICGDDRDRVARPGSPTRSTTPGPT